MFKTHLAQSLLLGSFILILSACFDWGSSKKPVFKPSSQMYTIFMVAHYEKSFTACTRVMNQEHALKKMDEARANPPAVFEEEEKYMTFGETELIAQHFFADKKACDFFAENLLSMEFQMK